LIQSGNLLVPLLIQSKVTPVIAPDKRLGANELLVGQLGKRIVEVTPRLRTEIDGPLLTEIIRDWTPNDVEGGSTVGGNGFDDVPRSIERKAQGHITLVVTMLANGKCERRRLAGRQVSQPSRICDELDRVLPVGTDRQESVEE